MEDVTDFEWGPSSLHRVVRFYRSMREAMPGLSRGQIWSFSFDRSFDVTGTTPYEVTITNSDGSLDRYSRTREGFRSQTSTGVLKPLDAGFYRWAHLQPTGLLDIYERAGNGYRLASTHTAAGLRINYVYDEGDRLTRIVDGFGRAVDLIWTTEGTLAEISNAEGASVYEHETVGAGIAGVYRVRSQSRRNLRNEELKSTRYHYVDGDTWQSHFLIDSIEHEPGVKFAQFTYDNEGRVLVSEHAGSAYRYTFSYPDSSSTIVTDPLGAIRRYAYAEINQYSRITEINQPGGSGCGPAARKFDYDPNGALSSLVKFNGQKICFVSHAIRALEISRIEGLASASSCPVSASLALGQRKISTNWHPVWDLKTGIAEPLRITNFIYNGQPDRDGKTLQCADSGTLPDGTPVAVICKRIEQATLDSTGNNGFAAVRSGPPRVTTYTYNAVGQMLSSTAADGSTSRYEYYVESSPSHTMGDLWKVIDPKGHVTEYLEYTPSGLATKIRTPQGTLTERSYDALRRITSQVIVSGTPEAETTTFSYNAVGLLGRVDLPDSSYLQYSYDAAERLTAISDKAGNTIQYTLDGMGNRVREEVRDASGALKLEVTRVYDVLNRLQDSTEKAK
ncbi:hypothetical protein LSQ66_15230 [Massilia endophytica]|nr:hypothetical protein LSQ66_15230 [Massilia endophytica]